MSVIGRCNSALETAYQEARATLAKEMLTRLTQQDPTVFEQVVLDVLLRSGTAARGEMPLDAWGAAEMVAWTG